MSKPRYGQWRLIHIISQKPHLMPSGIKFLILFFFWIRISWLMFQQLNLGCSDFVQRDWNHFCWPVRSQRLGPQRAWPTLGSWVYLWKPFSLGPPAQFRALDNCLCWACWLALCALPNTCFVYLFLFALFILRVVFHYLCWKISTI